MGRNSISAKAEPDAWALGSQLAHSIRKILQNRLPISIVRHGRYTSRVQNRNQCAFPSETLSDGSYCIIIELATVIDNDHARAERLHVIHIMSSEQHGNAFLCINGQQKFADASFCHHI